MSKKINSNNVWAIIPAFNEQLHIEYVLKKIKKYCKNIVVVDDGSSDQTAIVSKKFTPHLLSHAINMGKGAALKTGCNYAFDMGAKAVILLDGDDQHDADHLPKFISKLSKGTEVVLGVRQINNSMPLARRIGNICLSLAVMVLFGKFTPDILSGFRGFNQKAYNKIKWQALGYGVETEMVVNVIKANLKYEVVPIKTIYHNYSRGMTLLDAINVLIHALNLRIKI